VQHINALRPLPDVVLATGDLANDGLPVEYERVVEILVDLEVPIFLVPGNHDDRSSLRSLFPSAVPAGAPSDPIDYVVDRFPLRLIGLDTSVPGRQHGTLRPAQLAWLDEKLAEQPDRPTLIFQHHPPFVTGIDWMDADPFVGASEYATTLRRHANVEAVVCGHLHRAIHRRFAGTVASCWPSTGAQLALALNGERYFLAAEDPAVAIHRWDQTHGLTSHISHIGHEAPWLPKAWTEYPDQSLARQSDITSKTHVQTRDCSDHSVSAPCRVLGNTP
jgi:3',5'-cyclic-AMP phosphodiesterase